MCVIRKLRTIKERVNVRRFSDILREYFFAVGILPTVLQEIIFSIGIRKHFAGALFLYFLEQCEREFHS